MNSDFICIKNLNIRNKYIIMKLNIKKWESICNSDNEFKINSIKSRYSFLLNIIDDQISIQMKSEFMKNLI